MKLLISLMMLGTTLSSVQSGDDVQAVKSVESGDTIIDPIVPSHYEIGYNPIVRIGGDLFPEGSRGIGAIRIFIDAVARIERFEIISARIQHDGSIIYNYAYDRDSSKAAQLYNTLKPLVNSIKIKKLGNPILKNLEPYDLVVRFE